MSYITLAIKKSDWLKDNIRMEFTAGKVIFHGNKVTRGQIKKADYLLHKENIQLAIVSKPRYYQRIAIDKTFAEVAKD